MSEQAQMPTGTCLNGCKPRGRPKVLEPSIVTRTRLRPNEREQLKKLAKKYRIPLSSLIRHSC
jgi:hypothetical protein